MYKVYCSKNVPSTTECCDISEKSRYSMINKIDNSKLIFLFQTIKFQYIFVLLPDLNTGSTFLKNYFCEKCMFSR